MGLMELALLAQIASNPLGGGAVTQLVAGTNVTLSPVSGVGVVTINAAGGGGANQVTSGAADPVAAPANPAIANLYINTTTDTIWTWPAGGAAWQ